MTTDDVIGGEYDADCLGILGEHGMGGKARTGSGVSAHRLSENVAGRQLGKDVAAGIGGRSGCYDPHPLRRHQPFEPFKGHPQQRCVGGEGQKLLGTVVPRGGPEPGPRSSGHNDGVKHAVFSIHERERFCCGHL